MIRKIFLFCLFIANMPLVFAKQTNLLYLDCKTTRHFPQISADPEKGLVAKVIIDFQNNNISGTEQNTSMLTHPIPLNVSATEYIGGYKYPDTGATLQVTVSRESGAFRLYYSRRSGELWIIETGVCNKTEAPGAPKMKF